MDHDHLGKGELWCKGSPSKNDPKLWPRLVSRQKVIKDGCGGDDGDEDDDKGDDDNLKTTRYDYNDDGDNDPG